MRYLFAFILMNLCTAACISHAQFPWPGEAWQSSVNLTSLDGDFNINMSGQYWNSDKRELWVVSNSGIFWKLKEGGTLGFMIDTTGGPAKWNPGGDLEDITQANQSDSSVFIINEAGLIEEFDITVHGTVNKIHSWNITAQAAPNGFSGPEGIAFVPDEWLSYNGFVDQSGTPYTSVNGMGGLIFVAHQYGGYIYVFDLDRSNDSYTFVGQYASGYSESSGLALDRSTGKLFIWHNTGANYIEVSNLQSYDLGGGIRQFNSLVSFTGPKTGNLEGIAFTPASSGENWYFTTDDSNMDGFAVYWFQSFTPCVFSPFFTTDKMSACIGETITITDTTVGLCGGESFFWDFGTDASPATATGQGPHSISYSSEGIKNIKLRVEGLFTDSIVKNSCLTIHPIPAADLGIDIQLCNGDSALLDAGNAGCAYAWSTGSSDPEVYVIDEGEYSLTVINSQGCSDQDTVYVSVNPLSSINITPSEPFLCYGSEVILTADGASSYFWSSGDTTASVTFAPDSTTSYTVLATDSNGCTSSSSMEIFVLPIASFEQDLSICNGDSIIIGMNSYNSSGVYIDTLAGMNGCDSLVETHLIVNEEIDLTTSSEGSAITAHADNATFQWIDCMNGNIIIPGETAQTYSALQNGIYAVIITVDNCSDTSACVEITNVGINNDFTFQDIFNIFPNPSEDGTFSIENFSGEKILDIGLYDDYGRVCNVNIVGQQTIEIKQPGLYILRIYTDKQIYYREVIKMSGY